MSTQTNEINSLVVQYINDELPDALERAIPLWNHFSKEKGQKFVDGGLYYQFPIKLLVNQAKGFIPGTGAVVSATSSPQLQYGVLNWKYYNTNVNFTFEDYVKAQGASEATRNFFTDKVDGALADMARDLASAAWGSSSSAPLQFDGMQDILAASGTAYAGLLDTDYAAGTYLPYISTDTTITYSAIENMIVELQARLQKTAEFNSEMLGFMNAKSYSKYKSVIQNQQIAVNQNDVFKTGFRGFQVDGITFYLDAFCPGSQDGTTGDNWIVIAPASVLKFFYKYGFKKESPFDTGANGLQLPLEPLKSIQKYMAGNIVCTNRRLMAVGKSFVA